MFVSRLDGLELVFAVDLMLAQTRRTEQANAEVLVKQFKTGYSPRSKVSGIDVRELLKVHAGQVKPTKAEREALFAYRRLKGWNKKRSTTTFCRYCLRPLRETSLSTTSIKALRR